MPANVPQQCRLCVAVPAPRGCRAWRGLGSALHRGQAQAPYIAAAMQEKHGQARRAKLMQPVGTRGQARTGHGLSQRLDFHSLQCLVLATEGEESKLLFAARASWGRGTELHGLWFRRQSRQGLRAALPDGITNAAEDLALAAGFSLAWAPLRPGCRAAGRANNATGVWEREGGLLKKPSVYKEEKLLKQCHLCMLPISGSLKVFPTRPSWGTEATQLARESPRLTRVPSLLHLSQTRRQPSPHLQLRQIGMVFRIPEAHPSARRVTPDNENLLPGC